jgi:hypothetical protein
LLHINGNAALAGNLNVQPSTAYAASAQAGDDIAFGLYFGTQSGSFSTVAVNPSLNSGKTVTVDTTEPGEIEAVVAAGPKPTNTTPPTVSGTDTQGQTLSTTNGSWTGNPTFAYQWYDCDTGGNNCTAIGGANGTTNVLTASDVGHTIRVIVFATNGNGTAAAVSGQTGVVVASATAPTLSGGSLGSTKFKAKKGTTLSLTLNLPATVKGVITQNIKGHKVKGVCKAKAKKGTKCTINKKRKTLTFTGVAGANRFQLKTKGLKPGSYTLKVTASNSGGTSNTITLKFKIKK